MAPQCLHAAEHTAEHDARVPARRRSAERRVVVHAEHAAEHDARVSDGVVSFAARRLRSAHAPSVRARLDDAADYDAAAHDAAHVHERHAMADGMAAGGMAAVDVAEQFAVGVEPTMMPC